MSAIVGFYSLQNSFTEGDLQNMAQRVAHRGNSEAQYAYTHEFGVAHCNLAIPGGVLPPSQQPTHSANGRYIIAFDGDVSNIDELRREYLPSQPPISETEIMLQLIEKEGIIITTQFAGSYSIALYDSFEKKLSLFRDYMAFKPLYYFWDGEVCLFASELKALRAVEYVRTHSEINPAAVHYFLQNGYVGGTMSIYTNIYKVGAGIHLEFAGKQLKSHISRTITEIIQEKTITDFTQAKETLRDLVESSVRSCMQHNCTYASFLSGGTDSSLITAVMQHNSSARIQTFTVDFPDSVRNESAHAQKIAKHIGTEHHSVPCTSEDAKRILPALINIYDEPYCDSSALPTLLVSQAARQVAPIAFLGDGGDEMFMGYGAYIWAQRLQKQHIANLRKPLSALLQFGNDYHRRGAKVLNFPNKSTIPSHIYSQEQGYFSSAETQVLVANKKYVQPYEQQQYFNALYRPLSPAENQVMFDLHYPLQEELIPKVDRASMHYGLQTYAPLLSDSIVEFALNVDESLKLRNGEGKLLLKEVLYEYVPAEFFNRPKWGFSIPLHAWLRGSLSFLIDEWLSPQILKKHGVVNPKVVERYIYLFRHKKHTHLYNRLWALIVLHQFLEEAK